MSSPFVILRDTVTAFLMFLWILEFVADIADRIKLSTSVPLLLISGIPGLLTYLAAHKAFVSF